MRNITIYITEKFKISKDIEPLKYILILKWKPFEYNFFDSVEDAANFIRSNNLSWASCFSLYTKNLDDKKLADEFASVIYNQDDEYKKFREKHNLSSCVIKLRDELRNR